MIKELRNQLLKEQDYKCAICDKQLPNNNDVGCLDHQHLFKSDDLYTNGNGLIRGVLCRECNSLEGKIWNAIHRFGHADNNNPTGSRKQWLLKLIEYYNLNYSHSNPTLHPKEKRIERLSKSHYNKLIKHFMTLPSSYKRSGELKPIPKYTGRWSKTLLKLNESMIG